MIRDYSCGCCDSLISGDSSASQIQKYHFWGSSSPQQRNSLPQASTQTPVALRACLSFRDVLIPRWIPGFPEAFPELSTPNWTEVRVGQVIPSDLLSWIGHLYSPSTPQTEGLVGVRIRPSHGSLPSWPGALCSHYLTRSWTPEQTYLFPALRPVPVCHPNLSGEPFLQHLSQSCIFLPKTVPQFRGWENSFLSGFIRASNSGSENPSWPHSIKGTHTLEQA